MVAIDLSWSLFWSTHSLAESSPYRKPINTALLEVGYQYIERYMMYVPVDEGKPDDDSKYVSQPDRPAGTVPRHNNNHSTDVTNHCYSTPHSPDSIKSTHQIPDHTFPSLEYDLASKKWRILIFWTLVVMDSFAIPIILYFVLNYSTTLDKKQGKSIQPVLLDEWIGRWYRGWC